MTLTVAAALTAAALAGCGDDPVQSAQDTAQSAAQNAAGKAQQKAYEGATVAALAAIDPDLAADPRRTLIQAKAVCLAIENKTAAQAVSEARKRFGSGSVKVDDATAKRIIRALKKDLCPRL
jgi:hypothetical protein